MPWTPCYLHFFILRFPLRVTVRFSQGRARVLRARDAEELARIVSTYNGLADILYEAYPGGFVDKVRFELDGPLPRVREEASRLVEALSNDGFPVVPVWSGCHGYHVYALVEPFTAEPSAVRAAVASFVDYYASRLSLETLDRPASTSTGAVAWRLPGTVNTKCGGYSSFLPLDSLDPPPAPLCPENPTIDRRRPDIREYAVGGHEVSSYLSGPPDLGPARVAGDVSEYLKRILRPCIWYYATHDPEPPHFIRTHMVLELCWLGYSESEIVELIERLGWADYNRRITEYHVSRLCEKVRSQRLVPASCRTIQSRGYCLGPRACEWWPGYWSWWGHVDV